MHVSRYVCTIAFALALSAPAFAQEHLPVDAVRVDGAAAEPAPADQQPAPGKPMPKDVVGAPAQIEGGNQNVFKLVAGDFQHFFSADTAKVMSYFAIAAVVAAPWDREGVNNGFNIPTTVFQGGNVAGSFVFQMGAGFATYGIGRSIGNGKAANAGRDIVRAQVLSQVLVQGMKISIRRERPDGSNKRSFPSGHAASAFATAGVLHKYYGWKVGAPAYALGSYVALARMSWNRHHATDVVMGAGFGLASARTVTMSMGGSTFGVGVQPQVGGASVNFTKIYK
jgi:membrane-associated phospholipid phosphatase